MKSISTNQSGMTSIVFCLFMIMIMGLSVIFVRATYLNDQKVIKFTQSLYCIKQYHKHLNEHIQTIERINLLIIAANTTEKSTVFIPGMQGVALKARRIKQMLQRSQILMSVSFQKNVINLIRKNCPLPPTALLSPYSKRTLFRINRNLLGIAVVKRKKWTRNYLLPFQHLLRISYQKKLQKVKITPNFIF